MRFPRPRRLFRRIADALPRDRRPDASDESTDPHELAEAADKRLVFSLAKVRFPSFGQLRYLKEFLSKRERRTLAALLGIAAVGLLFLGGRLVARHIELVAKPGGEYVEAIVGQPRFINPLLATTNVDLDLSRLVFSGLTRLAADGSFVPDLAERVEVSEDKKTYTVTLRSDARWHDGENVTADDVSFTYQTLQDPRFLSPHAALYRNVTALKIDDRTIRFSLKDPATTFPALLAFGIVPEHLFLDVQPANFALTEFNLRPVGSGPFSFSSLTKNNRTGEVRSFELIRNETYYSARPNLERFTVRFYPTEEEARNAFADGKVLGFSGATSTDALELADRSDVTVHRLPIAQTVAVFLSNRHAPFKAKEVRRALVLAADRERILREAGHGLGELTDTTAIPGLAGVRDGLPHTGFDPAAANDLLEQAGWKRGGDGIRRKGNDVLQLTLTTADQTDYHRAAEILKENWDAIGVKVELQTVDVNRVTKDIIRPRNYQALLYAEVLGQTRDPFPFWHSTQVNDPGFNLSIFINKDVDRFLEEARQASPENRLAKYRDVQRILADELPAVFLYRMDYPHVSREKLRGVAETPIVLSADRFASVEEWYVKTRLQWK